MLAYVGREIKLYGTKRTARYSDFETSKRGFTLSSKHPSHLGTGGIDTVHSLW